VSWMYKQLENQMIFEEVKDYIIKYTKCINCGSTSLIVEAYEHPDGLKLKDRKKPLWIYAHCLDCGYDSALWKLVQKFQMKHEDEKDIDARMWMHLVAKETEQGLRDICGDLERLRKRLIMLQEDLRRMSMRVEHLLKSYIPAGKLIIENEINVSKEDE